MDGSKPAPSQLATEPPRCFVVDRCGLWTGAATTQVVVGAFVVSHRTLARLVQGQSEVSSLAVCCRALEGTHAAQGVAGLTCRAVSWRTVGAREHDDDELILSQSFRAMVWVHVARRPPSGPRSNFGWSREVCPNIPRPEETWEIEMLVRHRDQGVAVQEFLMLDGIFISREGGR
jgi:hypothetical protein